MRPLLKSLIIKRVESSLAAMEPSHYEVQAALKDGTGIIIRAIRPDDGSPLREQFANLSLESVRLRFHGLRRAPSESEARRVADVDFVDTVALVAALKSHPEELIAGARYIVEGDERDSAEIAFLVLDEYQGRGVGSLMLRHLAIIARAQGIREFKADVLADNERMIRVFERSGLLTKRSTSFGVMRLVLTIPAEPSA